MSLLDEDCFKDKYQRNNKQTGVKNLRCFPTCSPEGHQSTGFCGRSVRFTLDAGTEIALAEFTQVSSDPIFDTNRIARIADLERHTSLLIAKPALNHGELDYDWTMDCLPEAISTTRQRIALCGQGNLVMEFRVRRGWHYEWVSNRHTCMNLHCLRIYLFAVSSDGLSAKCTKIIDSPSFQVYSRRRSMKTLMNGVERSQHAVIRHSQESQDGGDSSDVSYDSGMEEKNEESVSSAKRRAVAAPAPRQEGFTSAPPRPSQRQPLRTFESGSSLSSRSSMSTLRHFESGSSVSSLRHFDSNGSMSAPSTFRGMEGVPVGRPLSQILGGFAAPPMMPSPGYGYVSPQVHFQRPGVNSSLLAELAELLEFDTNNQLRLDPRVSPIVFAVALQGICSPTLVDAKSFEIINSIKLGQPVSMEKKLVCQEIALHIARCPRFATAIANLGSVMKNQFELLAQFIVVLQCAIDDFVSTSKVDISSIRRAFQARTSSVTNTVLFQPMYPFGSQNGAMYDGPQNGRHQM